MEDQYIGSLNDLIVINNTRFLTTVSMPYPDPKEGYYNSFKFLDEAIGHLGINLSYSLRLLTHLP